MIPNYLSPLEFQITIKRLPNVEFFTQKVIIPSISTDSVIIDNPFNYIHRTPNKIDYSNLELAFIVDEKMNNYLEIFNWITDISFPQNFEQFKKIEKSPEGLESDISILVLNSNKNANINVNFFGCFPSALSAINLDTTQNNLIYPTATVTFKYDYFKIEQI